MAHWIYKVSMEFINSLEFVQDSLQIKIWAQMIWKKAKGQYQCTQFDIFKSFSHKMVGDLYIIHLYNFHPLSEEYS